MNTPSKSRGQARRILIIVENLSVPFDRRVWSEAQALRAAGYTVSIICPKSRGYDAAEETLEGIHIYRHRLPIEARGAMGYLIEYSAALFWEFILSIRVARRHGFDVIHACNPPDLIFIIGLFYKVFAGKSFLFDHHDICPEFWEAKFSRRGLFWKLLVAVEKCTFWTADIAIATNELYRKIATSRGGMPPDRVFVVRSGPRIDRIRKLPADSRWRNRRRYLVGYVGVISRTEGLDLLLDAVNHIVRRRTRSDVQFVVAGSGPEYYEVAQLCGDMHLNDFVTFTGRVDDETLFSMLSTADVCVNPDRVTPYNNLSTMNKIMEYMTLGRPIVQFDVIEGRFSAGDASLYAKANDPEDFGDKILTLLDDRKRRDRMGQIGEQRVHEKLEWSHEWPKLLKAYDTVFELRNKRAGLGQRLRSPFERLVSAVFLDRKP